MKSLAIILLALGLASAQSLVLSPAALQGALQGAVINNSQLSPEEALSGDVAEGSGRSGAESESQNNRQNENQQEGDNQNEGENENENQNENENENENEGQNEANAEDIQNLQNFNIGGLNFGNIDLNNQNDLANAIEEMLGALCIGNSFDINSILSQGSSFDLQMFLELSQLIQLQQLGFLNVFDIQNLLLQGALFGGFNNGFNFGVFKRAVDERKKTLTRTKLRRGQPLRSQDCSASSINAGAAATAAPTGAASAVASAAPAATATAAA